MRSKRDLSSLSPTLRAMALATEQRLAACLESGGHQPSDRLTEPRLSPGVPGIKRMTHVRMVICRNCDMPFRVGESSAPDDDEEE